MDGGGGQKYGLLNRGSAMPLKEAKYNILKQAKFHSAQ